MADETAQVFVCDACGSAARGEDLEVATIDGFTVTRCVDAGACVRWAKVTGVWGV